MITAMPARVFQHGFRDASAIPAIVSPLSRLFVYVKWSARRIGESSRRRGAVGQ
jgi:hypothetical protein